MLPYNRRRSRDGNSFLWFVERVWLGKKIRQRYGSEMVVLFRSCLARRMTLVHSKSNYCNSLFLNLDSIQIQRLQLIENSLEGAVTRTSRPYHINGVLKSLHWLEIPERTHFKVLSLTYNSLQSFQPTYLRELFTIQPTRSTRSSSCLTLSRHPVTFHLTFSKRAISVTAPRLWNDLPPELLTFSLPPPSSLQIIKHHLQHAPLSVTPGFSTRNSSPTSSSSLSLTHLIPFLLTPLLNYPRLNA